MAFKAPRVIFYLDNAHEYRWRLLARNLGSIAVHCPQSIKDAAMSGDHGDAALENVRIIARQHFANAARNILINPVTSVGVVAVVVKTSLANGELILKVVMSISAALSANAVGTRFVTARVIQNPFALKK